MFLILSDEILICLDSFFVQPRLNCMSAITVHVKTYRNSLSGFSVFWGVLNLLCGMAVAAVGCLSVYFK